MLDSTFIGFCLKTEDGFKKALDNGFMPIYLSSESALRAWDYCIGLKVLKKTPSVEEVALKFDLDLSTSKDDSLEAVTRRLRDRKFVSELHPYLEQATAAIGRGEPEKALEIMLQSSKLRTEFLGSKSTITGYLANWEERARYLHMLRSRKGMLGPVTRWPTFNKETRGFQKGYFYVFAGTASRGKSWELMLILDDLLGQDEKSLVYSAEMDPMRLQFRLDALRYKISYPSLKTGEISDEIFNEWMSTIALDAETKTDAVFLGKKDARTIEEIQLIASDLGVTSVLIDGGYRLAESREWKSQAKLVEQLQISAEDSGIPWIVTTQLGGATDKGKTWTEKKGGGSMRYAMEWMTEPDMVLVMNQSSEQIEARVMEHTFEKVRDGDGDPKTFLTHWKPHTGNYDEYTEEEMVADTTRISEEAYESTKADY